MFAWIARRTQLVSLKEDVAVLSERLAAALERSDAETARADELTGRVDMLERQLAEQAERLTHNETHLRRVDDERGGTADYLDRMIVRYDGHHEEVERLRADLTRLAHRFDLHAEDMTKTAAALLDRIERTRAHRF
jgi:chromosome segregation ATPase